MECIKVTEETMAYFEPLISRQFREVLRFDELSFAVGAVKEGKACGVLVCTVERDAVMIGYIAVCDTDRRQGVATGMVRFLCHYAGECGMDVACFFHTENQDSGMLPFFRSLDGFQTEKLDGEIYRISCEQLRQSKILQGEGRKTPSPAFFSLDGDVQKAFLSGQGSYGLEDVLMPYGNYREDLCLCRLTDGRITAGVFVKKQEDGAAVTYLYCEKDSSRYLPLLLSEVCRKFLEGAGEGDFLYLDAILQGRRKLFDYFFPQRDETISIYTARWGGIK